MPHARLAPSVAAMASIVLASNILVKHPFPFLGLEEILTWGAFTYPFAFLVTDLTNRWHGPKKTRLVVVVGFVAAVFLTLLLDDPRIALASGSAFLTAQLLDVAVFNRLRAGCWWRAPLVSSTVGSAVDTALFFSLAFAGSGAPWISLALGDFCVKMSIAILSLLPYASLMNRFKPYGSAIGPA